MDKKKYKAIEKIILDSIIEEIIKPETEYDLNINSAFHSDEGWLVGDAEFKVKVWMEEDDNGLIYTFDEYKYVAGDLVSDLIVRQYGLCSRDYCDLSFNIEIVKNQYAPHIEWIEIIISLKII